jgi:hypothetical protein
MTREEILEQIIVFDPNPGRHWSPDMEKWVSELIEKRRGRPA